jgi:hypothetical protein
MVIKTEARLAKSKTTTSRPLLTMLFVMGTEGNVRNIYVWSNSQVVGICDDMCMKQMLLHE